jgi:hypothetical protein
VTPQQEECDGLDNDCDGLIDNQLSLTAPLERPCTSACGIGRSVCLEGKWEACSAPQARPEICNGKDDDCDGLIDNNLTAPLCSKQQGVCRGALQRCAGEKGWIDCSEDDYKKHHPAYETQETLCDALDNDCDGKTDPMERCGCQEGAARSCYSGSLATRDIGLCQSGRQICEKGLWGDCKGESLPSREICDGKDNNCDGQIDETFPESGKACTAPNLPELCKAGTTLCVSGRLFCQPLRVPSPTGQCE